MNRRPLEKASPTILTIFLVFALCFVSHAERTDVEIPLTGRETLPGYYFLPDTSVDNPWPGVVVAANAGGAKLIQFHAYCRKLAKNGYAVLLLDASGYPPCLTPGPDSWRKMPHHIWAWINHLSVVARLAMGHQWYIRNIDSAVSYLASQPRVNSAKIAVSGFSQSANAALAYANKNSRIRCVVWNNGGWPWILPYEPAELPPVLIFHGEADGVYDVRYARELAAQLEAAKRNFECCIYPGERHMFNVYYQLDQPGDDDKPVLTSSLQVLVDFLERFLKRDAVTASQAVGGP
ncbi:MAG: dienelactone hydrolase family protein [Desulfomonile tiedjei]|nr:dienelactone hydrolase family protein [Desulfomonile tiedjei]